MSRHAIPYKDAIAWLANNDDCEYMNDAEPIASVSASLVADIYGRNTDEVLHDLHIQLAKE